MISGFDLVENIVGQRENAGYIILPLFYNVFKRLLSQGSKMLAFRDKGLTTIKEINKWVDLLFSGFIE